MSKNVCLSKLDLQVTNPSVLINNTNQQEQSQNISFELTECLRKTLTGEQFDDLMDMIQKKADKKTLSEKIREFKLDVVSGVLAGIISSLIMR